MGIIRHQRHQPRHGAFHHDLQQALEGFLDRGQGDESAVVNAQWSPRMDVREEAARFVIFADLPGVDPQDIEVQMDKGVLSIRGERRNESDMQTERFTRIERRQGSFHRRFALPDSADADAVTASG